MLNNDMPVPHASPDGRLYPIHFLDQAGVEAADCHEHEPELRHIGILKSVPIIYLKFKPLIAKIK